MAGFDRVVMVDWSARSALAPARPVADAIWLAEARPGAGAATAHYLRGRAEAEAALTRRFEAALAAGERVLAGFDFPFGYPMGFAAAITGVSSWQALWAEFAARIEDAPDGANNRFTVAADLNRLCPGVGPFWGRPAGRDLPDLPARGRVRHGHGLPERRQVEARVPSAQPCWKLYTTGSVGGQVLLGLPRLAALRERFAGQLAVWPFEPATAPIVLAEVYPSLLMPLVRAAEIARPGAIRDELQVQLLAGALAEAAAAGTLAGMLAAVPDGPPRAEEAWILGVGAEPALTAAGARALAALLA